MPSVGHGNPLGLPPTAVDTGILGLVYPKSFGSLVKVSPSSRSTTTPPGVVTMMSTRPVIVAAVHVVAGQLPTPGVSQQPGSTAKGFGTSLTMTARSPLQLIGF